MLSLDKCSKMWYCHDLWVVSCRFQITRSRPLCSLLCLKVGFDQVFHPTIQRFTETKQSNA